MEKTPSAFIFKACTGADPCAECLKIIKFRQESDPEWLPSKVLRHLAWNQHRLPFPESKKPDAIIGSMEEALDVGAVDAPKGPLACAKEAALEALQKQMEQATEDEDFLLAARLKQMRDNAKLELQNLLAFASTDARPDFQALPTSIGNAWASPGSNAYKSFEELCLGAKRQARVYIPVSTHMKRLEQVLPCEVPFCRYIAKTNAEYERHVGSCHGPSVAAKQSFASASAVEPGTLEGYTVAGCPPVLPKKRRRREAFMEEAEEDAEAMEQDGGAGAMEAEGDAGAMVQDDGDGVADALVDEAGQVGVAIPNAPRVMPGQRTDPDFLNMMPEFCAVPWISIKHDKITRFTWQAKYDHTDSTAAGMFSADALASLPKEYKQKTKDCAFRNNLTPEGEMDALKKVLDWAWGKHTHLTGADRPDYTRP